MYVVWRGKDLVEITIYKPFSRLVIVVAISVDREWKCIQ